MKRNKNTSPHPKRIIPQNCSTKVLLKNSDGEVRILATLLLCRRGN